MSKTYRETIILDPVIYDFLSFPKGEIILNIINSYEFQRLRRIKQLGLSSFVYPAAEHTRFQHSLGALWIMKTILERLRRKGVKISNIEILAAECAALLHDIGHGPFSHVLEEKLIKIKHEEIGKIMIEKIYSKSVLGKDLSEVVFALMSKTYPKQFLCELISGQLDVDRLDYLRRDAYFTGVNYGLIDVDRILQTICVVREKNTNKEVLAIEERGFFSVEDYLIARYSMFWSVYYHKMILAAEAILISIFQRVTDLFRDKKKPYYDDVFLKFMVNSDKCSKQQLVNAVIDLDDISILYRLKQWRHSPDKILADLCNRFFSRKLFKGIEISREVSKVFYEKAEEVLKRNKFNPKYYGLDRKPEDIPYSYYFPDTSKGNIIRIAKENGEQPEISQYALTGTLKAIAQKITKIYYFLPDKICRDQLAKSLKN